MGEDGIKNSPEYSHEDASDEAIRLRELVGKQGRSIDYAAAEQLNNERQDQKYFQKAVDIFNKYGILNSGVRPFSNDLYNSFQLHDLLRIISEQSAVLAFKDLGIPKFDGSADGQRSAQEVARAQNRDLWDLIEQKRKLLEEDFKEVTDYYKRRTNTTKLKG